MSDPWNTTDELHFLETQLGRLAVFDGGRKSLPRLQLLKNYKEASSKRSNWIGLDQKKILDTVDELILKEMNE